MFGVYWLNLIRSISVTAVHRMHSQAASCPDPSPLQSSYGQTVRLLRMARGYRPNSIPWLTLPALS